MHMHHANARKAGEKTLVQDAPTHWATGACHHSACTSARPEVQAGEESEKNQIAAVNEQSVGGLAKGARTSCSTVLDLSAVWRFLAT